MEIKSKSNAVNIVKKFIADISKDYAIDSVYLYGSYCYGSPHYDSDIDIAVILNEQVDDKKDFEIFSRALKVDLDLEVVAFSVTEFGSDASDLIVEIKEKGEKVA